MHLRLTAACLVLGASSCQMYQVKAWAHCRCRAMGLLPAMYKFMTSIASSGFSVWLVFTSGLGTLREAAVHYRVSE